MEGIIYTLITYYISGWDSSYVDKQVIGIYQTKESCERDGLRVTKGEYNRRVYFCTETKGE